VDFENGVINGIPRTVRRLGSGQHAGMFPNAADREGNNLQGVEDFCLQNGSSQVQNLALIVLCVPNSLDGDGSYA